MDTTRRRRSGTLAALLPGLLVVTVLATTAPESDTPREPVVQLTVTPGHDADS